MVSTISGISKGFLGFQGSLATLFDGSSLISPASDLASINEKKSLYLTDFDCCCVKGGRWVSMNLLLKKENL